MDVAPNMQGAPYWVTGTELTMQRAMIAHYRPEWTAARLAALTWRELDALYSEVVSAGR